MELYLKMNYEHELYAGLVALLVILISSLMIFVLKESSFMDLTELPNNPHQL